MKNNTQGFTLIELLIVIAIIGILAAVLIPNLLNAQRKGYDAGAIACGKSIQSAEAMKYVDSNQYSTPDLAMSGASAACAKVTFVGTPAVTNSGASYNFTVKDTRGSNQYTFDPSSMNTASQ